MQYVQYWEYACPAWHNSLTGEQSYRIESIQKHAVKIIYGHYCTDYDTTCSQLNICSLENHRSDLSKSFFRKSVMDSNKNLAIANRSRVSYINTNNNTMTLKSGLEVTQGH